MCEAVLCAECFFIKVAASVPSGPKCMVCGDEEVEKADRTKKYASGFVRVKKWNLNECTGSEDERMLQFLPASVRHWQALPASEKEGSLCVVGFSASRYEALSFHGELFKETASADPEQRGLVITLMRLLHGIFVDSEATEATRDHDRAGVHTSDSGELDLQGDVDMDADTVDARIATAIQLSTAFMEQQRTGQ